MDLDQRVAAFLFGCIPARLALARMALLYPQTTAPVLLAMAVGFALIYVLRWRNSGPETGGQPIWWDGLRPVHAAFYALAATLAWSGSVHASTVLLFDAALGLGAFLRQHRIYL